MEHFASLIYSTLVYSTVYDYLSLLLGLLLRKKISFKILLLMLVTKLHAEEYNGFKLFLALLQLMRTDSIMKVKPAP